jgi:Tfp pilus assembly protein PilV
MINKYSHQPKGFTLIEVLVAVFILITAVVVPLTISSKGIFYSNVVRDQSVASYLAQEGMEAVRLMRDNIFLVGSANNETPESVWQTFIGTLTVCDMSGAGCYFRDIENFNLSSCDSSCEPLGFNENSGYSFGTGEPSPFTRTIKTEVFTNPDRMKVEVTVSWKTNTLERSMTVTNYLTPWQL